MNFELDKKRLGFTVRFIVKFTLAYFIVSFASPILFDFTYAGESSSLEIENRNLATVASGSIAKDESISLGFVGDVMLDRGIEQIVSSYGGGDFSFSFERVYRELNEFDILFGNLEGVVSDKGKDLGAPYSFRANPEAIESLKFAGFDVLSLANNHAGDWGEESLEDAMKRLDEAGIGYAGAGFPASDSYKPYVLERKGIKVAYFSFTESTGMYDGNHIALAREERVKESIGSFLEANGADFIVAYFHFGEEYQRKSNARQKSLSRAAIDAGANLVIGSHPHVTQDIEKYKEGLIIYSLGNFIFDQYFSEETMQGWLLEVSLEYGGRINGVKICNIFINPLFQPIIFSCVPVLGF